MTKVKLSENDHQKMVEMYGKKFREDIRREARRLQSTIEEVTEMWLSEMDEHFHQDTAAVDAAYDRMTLRDQLSMVNEALNLAQNISDVHKLRCRQNMLEQMIQALQ